VRWYAERREGFLGRVVVRRCVWAVMCREILLGRLRGRRERFAGIRIAVESAIRSKHGRNRSAAGFGHLYSGYTLDHARFLHQGGIELRRNCQFVRMCTRNRRETLTPTDDRTIVTRKARVGRRRGCGPPKVIRRVGQEIGS